MKVMVLGKATARTETGELGNPEEFAAMGLFAQLGFNGHPPPATVC